MKIKIFLTFILIASFNAFSVKSAFCLTVSEALNKIETECKNIEDGSYSLERIGFKSLKELSYLIKVGTAATGAILPIIEATHKDWRLRYLLINEVISKTKDKKALEPLIKILKDKKETISVRSASAKTLGRIGGKEALSAVVSIANENVDNEIFQAAVLRALGNIGTTANLSLINKRLKHKNPFIRTVAARTLYKLSIDNKKPDIILPLIEMIDDAQFENRDVIIRLMGKAKEKRAIAKLIKIAKNEKQNYVYRCAAVEAIGNIGGESADNILLEILEDKDELIRGYAAEGLAKGKYNPKKESFLKNALNNTKDKYIQKKISKSISRLKGTK